MTKGRILLADNNETFVELCARFLRSAGYEVHKATSPEAARQVFQTTHLHLAIFDLRMENDDDEKDKSGLVLAQELDRAVPKLILTNFPAYQDVREALRLDPRAQQAAVDYVDKRSGLDALKEAVEQAFEQHVRINWDLEFTWGPSGPKSFLGLAGLLTRDSDDRALVHAAGELEDLLRRLFYGYRQLRIESQLWQDDGRVCLLVYTQSSPGATDSRILIVGERTLLQEGVDRLQDFAPETDRGTVLFEAVSGARFAGGVYMLQGARVSTLLPLRERFQNSRDRFLKDAVDDLLGKTLLAWHQHGQAVIEDQGLMALYRLWSGLEESVLPRAVVEDRVSALIQAVRSTSSVPIERDGAQITFYFPRQDPLVCPDPVTAAYTPLERYASSIVCKVSPGRITPDSVLVDPSHHTWLTDLTYAGQAPQWWDYLCLEAAVRFDLCEAPDLPAWYDFENCLVEPSSLQDRLWRQDVWSGLQSNVTLIEQIRRWANGHTGSNPEPYYGGLLVWAVRAMVRYEPGKLLTPAMQTRAAHLLLGAAMLARRLGEEIVDTPVAGSMRLDADGSVWLGEQCVASLSGLKLTLLRVLYDNHDRVMSRQEIAGAVFQEHHALEDASPQGRLSTLVGRLRDEIEPNPKHAQYLVTIRGRGYRLYPNGQKRG